MEHGGFSVFGVRFSGIAVAMKHGGCSVFRNRKRAAIDANRKLKTMRLSRFALLRSCNEVAVFIDILKSQ
jgi:hypothetical protein